VGYDRAPIGELFRGPVLRTPQGWVLLAGSVTYVALGALLLAAPSHIVSDAIQKLWIGCFFMPLLLFLCFVRTNSPTFERSSPNAAWGAVLTLFPIVFVWLRL
jgi:hypothetical protein